MGVGENYAINNSEKSKLIEIVTPNIPSIPECDDDNYHERNKVVRDFTLNRLKVAMEADPHSLHFDGKQLYN